MYDDVLGMAAGGTAGTGAVLATTGGEIGPLLIVAWGLALAGTTLVAIGSRLRAKRQGR